MLDFISSTHCNWEKPQNLLQEGTRISEDPQTASAHACLLPIYLPRSLPVDHPSQSLAEVGFHGLGTGHPSP